MSPLPFARTKKPAIRLSNITSFHANNEGVAVCIRCLSRHPEATAGAPWTHVPRCRDRACNGLLIFPDTVKGTAK